MADFEPTHPLGNDTSLSNGGVEITAEPVAWMVQLFASNGKGAAVEKALGISGKPGQASKTRNFTALPVSPDQWMLVAPQKTTTTTASLIKKIGKNGYVSEQSDSRVRFHISGPHARDLMARGCRLDLHDDLTGKGFCAQTSMAQVGVLLHQTEDHAEYDLYVYSGFARSFWHWLKETAAQF